MPKISGVYTIYNNVSGTIYVGKSKDIESRWKNHRNEMRRGVHNNQHLQRAYDKYGKDAFEFSLVCEQSGDLVKAEQAYHDYFKAVGYAMYNMMPCREGSSVWTGRKHTEEAKAKQRAAKLGTKYSAEVREANSLRTKLWWAERKKVMNVP